MSANVVDGLSALYALARLRPIDMTLPIWPAARRCIHTKKPMSSTTGSSKGMRLLTQLDVRRVELDRGCSPADRSWSACGIPAGPWW